MQAHLLASCFFQAQHCYPTFLLTNIVDVQTAAAKAAARNKRWCFQHCSPLLRTTDSHAQQTQLGLLFGWVAYTLQLYQLTSHGNHLEKSVASYSCHFSNMFLGKQLSLQRHGLICSDHGFIRQVLDTSITSSRIIVSSFKQHTKLVCIQKLWCTTATSTMRLYSDKGHQGQNWHAAW